MFTFRIVACVAGYVACARQGDAGRLFRSSIVVRADPADAEMLGSSAGSPRANLFLLFSENLVLAIAARLCCHVLLFVNIASRGRPLGVVLVRGASGFRRHSNCLSSARFVPADCSCVSGQSARVASFLSGGSLHDIKS